MISDYFKISNLNIFNKFRIEVSVRMLTYSFSDTGSDSLYQHLYKCIKNDILSRNLRAGEKLPSKRSFAKNLGISVITVENAYAQLISEGYLYSVPKKGFFVSDISALPPCAAFGQSTPARSLSGAAFDQNSSVRSLSGTAFRQSGTARSLSDAAFGQSSTAQSLPDAARLPGSAGVAGHPAPCIDLTGNRTDIRNFPFSIWAKLAREVLNESRQELVTNPPCGGVMKLRRAIVRHLRDFRGIIVTPEQIIMGAGTEYLYSLLIQLLGFDKTYAVEDPGYRKIARIYGKHRVSCCHIPLDASGVCVPALEASGADVLHLSPSHHFPTGLVTPISRRYELLGWAARAEDRYIIEDDYDSEFRMSGNPIPAMQSIDLSEKVIYINTFTKTLASTVRISYMILPRHLADRFYRELSFYSCTVSNFEQYTLAHFIENGSFEKHLNRMRSYYHKKRDMLIDRIRRSELAPFAAIREENSGLHFILELQTALSDAEVCERALQKGLRIAALSGFYAQLAPGIEHRFIVNYSALPEEQIDEAIRILCDILNENTEAETSQTAEQS